MIEYNNNDELNQRLVSLQMQVREDAERLDAAEAKADELENPSIDTGRYDPVAALERWMKIEELMANPDKYEEYFGGSDCA